MRGFRAVDRGRAKRRRTRGRMRRGSLTCVKTLREKYTLPNGSTSAPLETGDVLHRAADRRAGWRWKAWRRTMPQRQANGEPARQPPAPARDCKGNEHRKGAAWNRGKADPRKACDGRKAQHRWRGIGEAGLRRRMPRKACTQETRENPKRPLPRNGRAAIP